MKAGIKTSEFWLLIGTIVMGLTKVVTLPPWAYPLMVGIYELSRAYAKSAENKKSELITMVPSVWQNEEFSDAPRAHTMSEITKG